MLKKKSLILILATALALTACNGGQENNAPTQEGTQQEAGENSENIEGAEHGATGAKDEQKEAGEMDAEQTLNTWEQEDPTSLNSAIGSDRSSFRILTNVMEPLVRQIENTDDSSITTEPAGAESWEVSEDGLTWTFKIREGMKWSNGDPLTAKDYEFGITRSLDKEDGAGGMGWMLDCIKGATDSMAGKIKTDEVGVKAVDDTTLEITLNQETPYFLQLCSTRPTLPINQKVFEEHGENYGTAIDKIEFSGPFIITEWTHQTGLKLEKNPEYWDVENVHYETVDWRILEEETTRMNAFLNGEIDNVGTNIAEWQQQFQQLDNVFQREVKQPAVDYLFFNTEKTPFNNPKVRLAFSLAIDREEAIQAVYNGVGVPSYGLVMHGITMDEKEYRQEVAGPIQALYDKHPDPKALLVEGLEEEGLGSDPGALSVTLEFGGTSEKMKEIGDYLLNVFAEKLGVNVNVKLNEWTAFSSQVQDGNFEIGYMAWFADYNDPYHMLSLMLTDTDGLNTRWSNDEYDKLIQEGLSSKDPAERLAKYGEAESILSEESPVIPILNAISNTFRYDYVYGWQTSEFSTQGLKYGFTSGR